MFLSPPPPTEAAIRQRALSRWDNEGGALAQSAPDVVATSHELTNTELVHLRIRVIALKNLMIAVLAEGSEQQRQMARDMAALITPRPGYTQHPLTVHAADHINDLVARADRYRMDRHGRACAHPRRRSPVVALRHQLHQGR